MSKGRAFGILIAAVLLAGATAAAADGPAPYRLDYPGAVVCPEMNRDQDYNNLPDLWEKLHSRAHLIYTRVQLSDETRHASGAGNAAPPRSMMLDLNGGNAVLMRFRGFQVDGRWMPLKISSRFEYEVSLFAKNSGYFSDTDGCRAFVKIYVLGPKAAKDVNGYGYINDQPLLMPPLVHEITRSRDTFGKIVIPIKKLPDGAENIELRVGLTGPRVHARAYFEDPLVKTLPRANVFFADRPGNVYYPDETPRLKVRLSGVPEGGYPITLGWRGMRGQNGTIDTAIAIAHTEQGETEIDLAGLEPGHYDVGIGIDAGGVRMNRSTALAILPAKRSPREKMNTFVLNVNPYLLSNPFGFDEMRAILARLPFGRTKTCLWDSRQTARFDFERTNRLVKFMNDLRVLNYDHTGVFAQIPTHLLQSEGRPYENLYLGGEERVRLLFRNTISSFSDQVEDWQINSDDHPFDPNFLTAAHVAKIAAALKDTFNTPKGAALDFNALAKLPRRGADFNWLSLIVRPNETDALRDYETDTAAVGRRHLAIRLPADEAATPDTHALVQFVHAVLNAKRHMTGRISVDLLSHSGGALFNLHGEPTQYLAPLANACRLLDLAAPYLPTELAKSSGMIFPYDTPNYVFRHKDTFVIAFWRRPDDRRAFTNSINLGRDAKVVFTDGSTVTAAQNGILAFRPDDMPSFIVDPEPANVKTRMSLQMLDPETLVEDYHFRFAALYQKKMITITNHYDRRIAGSLQLMFPSRWDVRPDVLHFNNLQPGETIRRNVNVLLSREQLPRDANFATRLDIVIAPGVAGQPAIRETLDIHRPFSYTETLGMTVVPDFKAETDRVLPVTVFLENRGNRPMNVEIEIIHPTEFIPNAVIIDPIPPGGRVQQMLQIPKTPTSIGRIIRIYAKDRESFSFNQWNTRLTNERRNNR